MEPILEQFAAKKAFEIAYAVFRISAGLPHRQFADVFEKKALSLLDAATDHDFKKTILSIDALTHFLQLGASLNLVHPTNSEIVINEARVMRKALADGAGSADVKAVDLEGIFTIQEPQLLDDVIERKVTPRKPISPKKEETQSLSTHREDDQLGARAKIRQSAILERIRQSGNCRIKELQDFLPDLSDRSLRYDLQALIEQGTIERIGNGPSTFYRVREVTELPSGPHPLELIGNQ